MTEALQVADWGRLAYEEAWERQKALVKAVDRGEASEQFVYVEHPHVYTTGRHVDQSHFLRDRSALQKREVPVVTTDRGGQVTYHGPGQLVGYVFVTSARFSHDTHRFLRLLESALIGGLAAVGIQGEMDSEHPGVWVQGAKLASIGIKFNKRRMAPGYITSHGFALNVTTDLAYFEAILPCGTDRPTTSVQRLQPQLVDCHQVAATLRAAIAREIAAGLGFSYTQWTNDSSPK